MKIRAKILVPLIIVVIAVALGYVFLGGVAIQEEKTTLTVITRLAPDESNELKKRFLASYIAREYGIVDVVFIKEDVSKWPTYAKEGRADLFFVGGYSVFKDLCEKGYFRAISDQKVINRVNELKAYTYKVNDQICFIAVSRTVFSFTINKNFIDKYGIPTPKSWDDLVTPEYSKPVIYGEYPISFPKPTKSTTSARTIQLILEKYGWEKGWVILTLIGANSWIVESSGKARDDVALGVTGAAPTVLVYGIRAEKASGGAAEFVAAENGVFPDISPVAIASGSKNPDKAVAFILWLLSNEGQQALAELFYYIPYIRPEGTEIGKYYDKVQGNIYPYDPEEAALWDKAAVYYFEAAIADEESNSLLKEIWKQVLAMYYEGKLSESDLESISEELGKPLRFMLDGVEYVFDRETAIKLNNMISEDVEFRAKFIEAVREAAIKRYKSILETVRG